MNKRIKHYFVLIMVVFMLIGCKKLDATNSSHITNIPTSTTEDIVTTIPEITITPEVTTTPSVTPTPVIITPEITPELTTTNNELQAEEIIESMTLEEKVGQLFFVRSRDDLAITDIETYHLGGYVLFAKDFEDKSIEDVKDTIGTFQETSKIPMLIGVDEEGGVVNRLSKYPQFRSAPFQSPQALFEQGGFDLILSDTTEKTLLLKSLGINVNLAPVCDVSTNPKDFIYNRSFGQNAKVTAEYVKTVVTEMNRLSMGSTLKHFPGYGNNVDTHTGIAIDERTYDSFIEKDFIPFQAGIESGAGSILVSHNIVKCMDENLPASLSPSVHNILRDELNFSGVIMTDDLYMDAIKQYSNDEEAAILAIKAGNDLLIATDFDVQIPAVINAVKNNQITEERINESVKRVLLWKLNLGIID